MAPVFNHVRSKPSEDSILQLKLLVSASQLLLQLSIPSQWKQKGTSYRRQYLRVVVDVFTLNMYLCPTAQAKGKQGRTPTSLLPEPVDLVQFQPPTVSESEWAKMLFKAVSAHVTSGDKPMT